MSGRTKTVYVTLEIEVTLDESKFTPEFEEEFNTTFFMTHSINDHYEHLAQMFARGVCDNSSFIEGYGLPKDMGIELCHVSTETEIV